MLSFEEAKANEQHKVSVVICLKCYRRWVAVRHIDTKLVDLECPLGHIGYTIESGETV